MRKILLLTLPAAVGLYLGIACSTEAQNLDVPYVPTPQNVVEAMLDVTGAGPGDYVIDLGSGDGRIVIAAAQRGAFGHGIDLNPVRVKEAEENAANAGISDRVVFIEGDLFEADISNATVITMYLLSSVNLRLKPVLLEVMRPGTRIVSHSFSMGSWEADEHLVIDNRHVYYWVIPANARGTWEWNTAGRNFTMDVKQEFQNITVNMASAGRPLVVEEPLLKGERISFAAVDRRSGDRYMFSGRIDENKISGKVLVRGTTSRSVENWSATLTGR